ncbi:MAG: polysaccharide deacetylase family protein [Lentilactobacillus hilgardii]|uniref:polysaccharide deacetylase family protein n=1 Tax=Lactobacillaceae TaxID=33958 RepID=UPI0039E9D00B
MKNIKNGWHIVYILIFVVAVLCSIKLAYSQKVIDNESKSELSTRSFPKNQEKRNGIQILCYHRIVKDNSLTNVTKKLSNNDQIHEYSVTLPTFKHQIKTLKQHHARIISMKTAEMMMKSGKKFKHQYVVITFDDCDQTIFENAVPFLEQQGIPYTMFIVTGQVGNYNRGNQMEDWSKIQSLNKKSKLVTFGFHSNNFHYLVDNKPALTLPENYQAFKKDLHESQEKFQNKLHIKSNLYAYPYGKATDRIQDYLQKHGYVTFSLNMGIIDNDRDTKKGALPRIMVTNKSWKQGVLKWLR